ncbi:MAG: DEAD/DEAH box helicase, partial [Bacteroidaceae bacterium]|nr:DEAD/DEAH box helicase [Bacteroidaceae bacterium]
GNVDLSRCSFFILDEADRMLDMGFSDDIMQIAKFLPPKGERQTIMFSATMPREIQQLASTLLHDPAEVKLAVSKPADGIHQSAYVCHEAQKMGVLKHLFAEKKPERVIIFAGSKLKVKDMAIAMRRAGYNVGAMHSDLSQAERDEVMFNFKSQKIDILVATDIVARGIDIDDIQLVVNYDVPHDAEDYVHRVGRTARAGAEGRAITLISSKDQPLFGQIERFLERVIDKNPMPPELGEAPEYTGNASRRKSLGKTSRKGKKKPRSGNKPKQSQAKSNDPKRAEGKSNKDIQRAEGTPNESKPSQTTTNNIERAAGTPQPQSNETPSDNPSPKPRRRKHRRRPNGKGSAGQNGAATGAEQGS